jgi:integrase/recombinase XerC
MEALFLSNRDARLCQRQIANRLAHWLRKAGIEKDLMPHGLRHTFATHLYGATNDLLVVQRALGHRDVSTTQIYTHLVDGQLEEALERL